MPFTLAHSAAALPFRRLHLVTSALVIGTFAPDFEYFLRLAPDRGFGHTIAGVFVLTLPVALVVLWIFHAFVKRPAAELMPHTVRVRLSPYLGEFRFGGTARFALIVTSALLGIATHLLWDSFTHPGTWAYQRCPLLRQPVHLPVLGVVPYYKVFQHASTLIGSAIVMIWLVCWYRKSEPPREEAGGSMTPMRRFVIIATMTVVAFAGAVTRAMVGTEFLSSRLAYSKFTGETVTAFIAFLWWQAVVYGLVSKTRSAESFTPQR